MGRYTLYSGITDLLLSIQVNVHARRGALRAKLVVQRCTPLVTPSTQITPLPASGGIALWANPAASTSTGLLGPLASGGNPPPRSSSKALYVGNGFNTIGSNRKFFMVAIAKSIGYTEILDAAEHNDVTGAG